MSWNYRIIQFDQSSSEGWLEMREVYYEDDDGIWAYTTSSSSPAGETIEEAKRDWQAMGKAFDEPVLLESELPGK